MIHIFNQKKFFSVLVLMGLMFIVPVFFVQAAELTNGMDAAYVIGAGSGSQDFTEGSSGTTASTFNGPFSVVFDATNDRLFVAEQTNYRILVFNTDSYGVPLDYTADYVIGQTDFVSSESGTRSAFGI